MRTVLFKKYVCKTNRQKNIYYFVKAIKVMIAWDQAPHCEKKEKKIGVGEKKKISQRSEPRGSLARLASSADNFPF